MLIFENVFENLTEIKRREVKINMKVKAMKILSEEKKNVYLFCIDTMGKFKIFKIGNIEDSEEEGIFVFKPLFEYELNKRPICLTLNIIQKQKNGSRRDSQDIEKQALNRKKKKLN